VLLSEDQQLLEELLTLPPEDSEVIFQQMGALLSLVLEAEAGARRNQAVFDLLQGPSCPLVHEGRLDDELLQVESHLSLPQLRVLQLGQVTCVASLHLRGHHLVVSVVVIELASFSQTAVHALVKLEARLRPVAFARLLRKAIAEHSYFRLAPHFSKDLLWLFMATQTHYLGGASRGRDLEGHIVLRVTKCT